MTALTVFFVPIGPGQRRISMHQFARLSLRLLVCRNRHLAFPAWLMTFRQAAGMIGTASV